MSQTIPKRFRQVSLRWVLMVPLVVQVGALSLGIGVLTHWHGRRLIEQMASQLAQESALGVQEHFQAFASTPQFLLQTHAEALALGLLNLDDPDRIRRYFWQQLQWADSIQTLYYGDETGDFLLVQRTPEPQLHRFNLADNVREIYRLQTNGEVGELLQRNRFDPRHRPWYSLAQESGQPIWTPIYVFAASSVLGITAATPFVTADGSQQGVLGIDLTLEQLSQQLQEFRVHDWGQLFIVESDGLLVASSGSDPPFLRTPGGQERIYYQNSADPLIRVAGDLIYQEWGGFDQGHRQGSLSWQGQRYFIQTSSLRDPFGLNWELVVVVPESYFLNSIWANHGQAFLITVLVLGLGCQGAWLTYRRVARPLEHLTTVAHQLEDGSLAEMDTSGSVTEIAQLVAAVTQVNINLKETFRQQQVELDLALEAGKLNLWSRDPYEDDRPQQWSRQTYRSLGINPAEYPEPTRQTFLACIHPEDRWIVQGNTQRYAASLQPLMYEIRILTPNGEIRWLRVWGQGIRDDQGQLVKIVGGNQDITHEKQEEEERLEAAQALKISEAKLRSLINSLPFRVWARDEAGKIILQNKIDVETYGDCLGTTIEDLDIDPKLKDRWRNALKLVADQGMISQQGSRSINGEERHFYYIAAPVMDDSLRVGIIGVDIDITEQIKTQEALQASEAKFRALVNHLPFPVWARDREGYLIFQNDIDKEKCGDLIGTSLDDIPFLVFNCQDDKVTFSRVLAGEVCTKESRESEGIQQYFYLNIFAPVPLEEEIIGVIGICLDITDIKRSELYSSQLAAIVNSSVDAIFSTDLEGKVLTWNPGAEKIYGYTQEEMVGDLIQSKIPCLLELYHLGKSPSLAQHYTRTSQPIEVFITASPLRDMIGEDYGISWIISDISYEKELNRLQNEFISVVSHELRTPLTSIHGSLTALNTGRLGTLSPAGQELLTIAEQNTTRLIRLINDILDLEKLNNDENEAHKCPCYSADLIQDACSVMAMMAEKANVTLNVSLVDVTIWGNPDQIIQVLTNLLSNAIKYSPSHGTIAIVSELRDQQLWISVVDQGPGIPAEQLEIIFEPFRQVDASDSRKKGGTGLGLAICRQIVTQHQGRIWAESEQGQGCTIWITLPIYTEDN